MPLQAVLFVMLKFTVYTSRYPKQSLETKWSAIGEDLSQHKRETRVTMLCKGIAKIKLSEPRPHSIEFG